MMQPVHGYDVRRELENWQAQDWANIAPGSIYHALRRLAEEELLAEVATEQVDRRPARTTYRMTAKGEEEFGELLRRYWWEYRQAVDPFMAGFAFTPDLPRREAAAALRNRARVLRAEVDTSRFALASEWMKQTKPVHVAWIFELTVSRLEVEIAWCEKVAGRIEAGADVADGPLPWPDIDAPA
jgi:DNA-binding PadR family transcriptional regulator